MTVLSVGSKVFMLTRCPSLGRVLQCIRKQFWLALMKVYGSFRCFDLSSTVAMFCTHERMRSRGRVRARTHTHACAHTHTHTVTRTHNNNNNNSHTHAHKHILSLSLSNTQIYTRARARAHTHTHTHTAPYHQILDAVFLFLFDTGRCFSVSV